MTVAFHTCDKQRLKNLSVELTDELHRNILEPWLAMIDTDAGGFFCHQDQDGEIAREADKSTLLHARILYSFARAYRVTGVDRYRQAAEHAHRWLVDRAIQDDRVVWATDRSGRITDDLNHMYNQGFVIYALAAWARASGDDSARDQAVHLWRAVERHAWDATNGGYLEAFDAGWRSTANDRLCDTEDGILTAKSMNTHLHLLEAWTELYRIAPHPDLVRSMEHLLDQLTGPLYDAGEHRFHLFAQSDWTVHSSSRSFGHDIEGSWLLWEAARLLSPSVQSRVKPVVMAMCDSVLTGLESSGPLWNERRADGSPDKTRTWWVQAEAIVGFVNAFELSGESAWLDRAESVWAYIQRHQRDPLGDWYWAVSPDNRPDRSHERMGPWKCPYHNSRLCLEVLERIG
ncbi:AGE family epimerase/isomerase [Saccharospirillum salsuginis]|uniref:Cellobiose 2-epimerase n=1 Tax=Saccharospirillum salsuginis TaxID=418750 RepID=A0A918N8W3_9GAMM|nr:AGE family epimerase/isomerase [Saccharospirillum salsuginis]GGX49112.1 cellobiose 2-epimerase [Saccharospirillum salsuginis]